MILSTNSILLIIIHIYTILIITQSSNKCHPNQNMKYQLNYTSYLQGYHSICSQYSKRTCCSGKNFQTLSKKITAKLIVSPEDTHTLSIGCRRKLTNLLCSTCDGDIGDKSISAVCPNVCQNIYQQCKQDYFSIDSLNKIKACRDDDIICSKLVDIINSTSKSWEICQMFGFDVAEHDCWNGKPSSHFKGPSNNKVGYVSRPSNADRNTQQRSPNRVFSLFQKLIRKIQPRHWVFFGILCFLVMFFAYKFLSNYLKNQSRKIKNL